VKEEDASRASKLLERKSPDGTDIDGDETGGGGFHPDA
jgi:hypothetical protein